MATIRDLIVEWGARGRGVATGVLRELLRRHPGVEEVHALVRHLAPQQKELWEWLGRLGFKETEVADVDLPEAPRRGGPEEAQKYVVVKAADLRDRLGEEAEPWEVEVEMIVTDRCRMRGDPPHMARVIGPPRNRDPPRRSRAGAGEGHSGEN